MRTRRDEVHISLHSETRSKKDAVAAKNVIARKSHSLDKGQPFFNAAGFCAVSIMVENAFAPGETELRIFAARENRSVLYRNTALIKIPIERPSLELAAREPALMHEQVKRMLVV